MGEHGDVLDVAPGVIGMGWGPDGARLGFYRQQGMGRADIMPTLRLHHAYVQRWLGRTRAHARTAVGGRVGVRLATMRRRGCNGGRG